MNNLKGRRAQHRVRARLGEPIFTNAYLWNERIKVSMLAESEKEVCYGEHLQEREQRKCCYEEAQEQETADGKLEKQSGIPGVRMSGGVVLEDDESGLRRLASVPVLRTSLKRPQSATRHSMLSQRTLQDYDLRDDTIDERHDDHVEKVRNGDVEMASGDS